MTRKFIAPILAASIALTSISATPVHAGNRDDQLGQFIAGAIALMIIGKAIESNKRNNRPRPVITPTPAPQPAPAPVPPRHVSPPRFSKVLPDACLFNVRDQFGQRDVYGKRCLRDNLNRRQVRDLPPQCADRVRIRQGRRANVYDARCLSQFGYKDETRRR